MKLAEVIDVAFSDDKVIAIIGTKGFLLIFSFNSGSFPSVLALKMMRELTDYLSHRLIG